MAQNLDSPLIDGETDQQGISEDWTREQALLHVLHIGKDCVDVQMLRWALFLRPEEDVYSFLAPLQKKKICGYSTKTGLVKRGDATPPPATPLQDHPNLLALGRLLDAAMSIFVSNGNVHVSYWSMEKTLEWMASVVYAPLREHFTLPRLLALFSLFDHNFPKRTCALSMRNYAVWGAEPFVKRLLLDRQGGSIHEPLAAVRPPLDALEPGQGPFFSLVDVARELKWSAAFAPHVGELLEWAWRTPGIELGIRLSTAEFAPKDCKLEDKDLSEKAALHALSARLGKRPGFDEHIASCRQGLNWREYNLGPLERFVRKYTNWFVLEGDRIVLQPDKASELGLGVPTHAAEMDAPDASLGAVDAAAVVVCAEDEDDQDASDEEDDVCPVIGEEVNVAVSGDAPGSSALRHLGPLGLFRVVEGLSYQELCMQRAVVAPSQTVSIPHDFASVLSVTSEMSEKLGNEMLAFAAQQCLTEADWQERQKVCEAIESTLRECEALNKRFPALSVSPFGTSVSGLGQKGSDLDLLLDLDSHGNRELQRSDIQRILDQGMSVLLSAGASELEVIAQARIPLLRGCISGIRFDLTIGSHCALWNTSLLRSFVAASPSIMVPLCAVVAAWSKAQGVNDSPGGLLSTYSVMLMVVFFLQFKGVLPSHDLMSTSQASCQGPPPQILEHKLPPAELGLLLIGFFSFAAAFRWDAWVASVRCGAPLLRDRKPQTWRVNPLCVEDPFETHLNTCRRVNPRGQRVVLTAFGAALRTLLAGRSIGDLIGSRNVGGPARQGWT